jgi:excisionase family DNA binding protein
MTAGQVAELLAVPKTRVWSMSRRGEIPTVRIGPREVRYRPEDIEVDRSADDVAAAGHAVLRTRSTA